MARVKVMWLAIQFIKIDHELRGIVPRPRGADQRAGNWLHRTVGITIFPHQTRFDRVLPGDIDHSD